MMGIAAIIAANFLADWLLLYIVLALTHRKRSTLAAVSIDVR
jgi:hypothetical protein